MQIVKLGGSVVTIKEKPMAADHDNIRRLAEEVKAAFRTVRDDVEGQVRALVAEVRRS